MNTFKFLGFSPSFELVAFAKQKLQQVFELSPSDSSTLAKIEKSAEGFKGELKIHSLAGKFVAKVTSTDPIKAIDELSQILLQELKRWKSLRILGEHRVIELEKIEIK